MNSSLFGRAFPFLDRFPSPHFKSLECGKKKRRTRKLLFEACEDRRVLAATISGIKFDTLNAIGFSPGDVPLGGVTINLYQDNGDGIFNPAIDPLVDTEVTAPVTGAYTFSNVADGRYFINEVVPTGFVQSAGPPFYTVDVINMAVYSAVTTNIDNFSDPTPAASWFINALNPDPFFRQDVGAGIIGLQRDLVVDVLGPSNPISANGFIGTIAINNGVFNLGTASSGAGSQAILQYDGVDIDSAASNNALGLNADLTANGNNGIRLDFDFLQVGAGVTMPMNIVATSPGGTATFSTVIVQNPSDFSLFVPFAGFATVGAFTFANVTSLTFTFNNTGVPDVDFQIDQIVGANQNNTGFNFGNFPLPSDISGVKYVDSNDNGVRDPGEPPVGGVIITLTGTNDLGQPVNIPTLTAADGTYSFNGLRPGTYTVTETPPDNFITGKLNAPGTVNGVITGMSVFVGVNPTFTFVVLPADSSGIDYNFGELGLKPPFVSKRAFIVPEIPAPLVAVYNTTPVTTTTTTAVKTIATTPVKTTPVAKATTVKKTTKKAPVPAKTSYKVPVAPKKTTTKKK